ncbi:hypothetical protein C7M84_024369 [Penaeus vannamei]|uniref:Uncharacterized protein n=1 Tax=Penaeus vannamei TaxID=6689 RepID=A0A423U196_PENVA|nr:hypothetical protein C7M84_024369 [Penaeus vannamei]
MLSYTPLSSSFPRSSPDLPVSRSSFSFLALVSSSLLMCQSASTHSYSSVTHRSLALSLSSRSAMGSLFSPFPLSLPRSFSCLFYSPCFSRFYFLFSPLSRSFLFLFSSGNPLSSSPVAPPLLILLALSLELHHSSLLLRSLMLSLFNFSRLVSLSASTLLHLLLSGNHRDAAVPLHAAQSTRHFCNVAVITSAALHIPSLPPLGTSTSPWSFFFPSPLSGTSTTPVLLPLPPLCTPPPFLSFSSPPSPPSWYPTTPCSFSFSSSCYPPPSCNHHQLLSPSPPPPSLTTTPCTSPPPNPPLLLHLPLHLLPPLPPSSSLPPSCYHHQPPVPSPSFPHLSCIQHYPLPSLPLFLLPPTPCFFSFPSPMAFYFCAFLLLFSPPSPSHPSLLMPLTFPSVPVSLLPPFPKHVSSLY